MAAIAVMDLPTKEKTRAAGQGTSWDALFSFQRQSVQRRNSSGSLAMFAAIRCAELRRM
jgi:hypothetical protein